MGIKQGKSDGLAYAKNIINRLVLRTLSKENESALKHLFFKIDIFSNLYGSCETFFQPL